MSSSVVRRLWVHSFPTTIAYLLIGASHPARLILLGFISHTCPIHSIRVGVSSLSGGLSPIATGSGNGCMAVDQW